jgi:hypothetical protein
MLSINCAECRKQAHYAECRYAECRYAECRSAVRMTCEKGMRCGSVIKREIRKKKVKRSQVGSPARANKCEESIFYDKKYILMNYSSIKIKTTKLFIVATDTRTK